MILMTVLTGIPQEQEMPAPVTMTIFLLLATARDIPERVLRADASVDEPDSEMVVTMVQCGGRTSADRQVR